MPNDTPSNSKTPGAVELREFDNILAGSSRKESSSNSGNCPMHGKLPKEKACNRGPKRDEVRPTSKVTSPIAAFANSDGAILDSPLLKANFISNHFGIITAGGCLSEFKNPLADNQRITAALQEFSKGIAGRTQYPSQLSSNMTNVIQPAIAADSNLSSAMSAISAVMHEAITSNNSLAKVVNVASVMSYQWEQILKLQTPDTLDAMGSAATKALLRSGTVESSISRMTEILKGLYGQSSELPSTISARLTSTISPALEPLAKIPGSDWGSIQTGLVKWGEYGWVFIANAPMSLIFHVPESRKDADKAMRSYASNQYLGTVQDRLETSARKKKDLAEALWLLDQRHYKPCAMMLCSLIEGELLVRTHKGQGKKGYRQPKETVERMEKNCRSTNLKAPEALEALEALGAFASFHHYFRNGQDFNRAIEDDLNRNFLQHGMMYKRVTRTVCVKLILLLDALITSFDTYL